MYRNLNKVANSFDILGNDVQPNIDEIEILKESNLKVIEESDEDDVYPLSIKYERKKVWKINIYKFVFLICIILLIIPYDIYSPNDAKSSEIRIGYFADRIYTKSISISGVTEFNIKTKNCIVYILENKDSSNIIDLYVSASRSTSINVSQRNTIQDIFVQADSGTVQCFVEIKIPGGVTIPKLAFILDGDTIDSLQIYDFKNDSKWATPLIISTLTFTISNAYPNIYFKNSHQISSLVVSGLFCNCDFQYMKIASMTFTVNVGSLNILQNSMYTQNSITVKTPHGTHCIAGATVNTVDSNCPSTSTRNSGISGTYVDTSSYCQSILYVCSNSASSCPSSGTSVSSGQGSFSITLDDGPVQFLIDGSTTTASSTYNPTFDSFSITSQILLTKYKTDFSSYPNDPRIYLYEVVSPGYKRMWVHSSLEQYIQARPWLISMLSLNILSPTYIRNQLIHIPSATCPTNNGNNVKKNTLISKMLKSLVYTESVHFIGQAANDTYYKYQYTEEGDYIQSEVSMFSGSSFILLSIIVSLLISLFSVIFVFIFWWRTRKILGKIYGKYLDESRKLAKFKVENESEKSETTKFLKFFQKIKVIKILTLGIFTTKVDEELLDEEDIKENYGLNKKKYNKNSTISFFKAPELYIDYLIRSKSNSLREFLNSIYESASHFKKSKLSSESYLNNISTRIDLLTNKYIEFCTKEGYKPRQIEEEIELLKEYNLEIYIRSDSFTNTYVNIRWKTVNEKLLNNQNFRLNKSNLNRENKKFNSILTFLESECIATSFKSDFILVSEVLERYDEFCRERNITDISKLKLEESNEMIDFGAEFKSNFSLPYVKGIILTKIYGHDKSKDNYLNDIVRVPKNKMQEESNSKLFKNFCRRFNYFMLSKEGLITNFFIVIIHLLIIAGIPLLILLAVAWSLIQINTINQNIFTYVFRFSDIFNSSSYNFWFDDLTGKIYFYIVSGLCCLFFMIGLIELICYYATGARDTGKYVVRRTWPRYIITILFWVMIFIFIAIYTAYISMILVWCILGAVLNPQKFLPFSTGAIVIIGFCGMIYSKLKQIDETLKEVISTTLNDGLINSISSNFEKEKVKLMNLMLKPVTSITQKMFYESISSLMKNNNLPQIEKDVTDKILEGDITEIALVFNKALGVDKNISLGLVGLLLKDQTMIMNSIYHLSNDNKFNLEMCMIIAEIVFNSYDPSLSGINEVDSSVILTVKKLFSKLVPEFPLDAIDIILQIILEADPRPLGGLWRKLKIPTNFFEILLDLSLNNNAAKDSLCKFAIENVLHEYKDLFLSLYSIIKGDLTADFSYLAKTLNVKYGFLIKMMIAMYKNEEELTRQVLNELDVNIKILSSDLNIKINSEYILQFKNNFRVIHQILNGSEIGITKLVERSISNFNPASFNSLKLAVSGDMLQFSKIVDIVGLNLQRKGILEFISIIKNNETDLIEISKRIGISKENVDVVNCLFKFIKITSKVYINLIPKVDKLNDKMNSIFDEDIIRLKEAITIAKVELDYLIYFFIKKGIIKVKTINKHKTLHQVKLFSKIIYNNLGGVESSINSSDEDFTNSYISESEIEKFKEYITDSIFKGNQDICKKIIDSNIEFLQLNRQNMEFIRSLLSISVASFVGISKYDLKYKNIFQGHFRLTSEILGITDTQLEFLLDLASESPFRLFKVIPSELNYFQFKNIIEDADQFRINAISSIIGCGISQVNQIGSLWLNNSKLLCNNEEITKSFEFFKDKLNINPIIFYCIHRVVNHDTKDNVYNFTKNLTFFTKIIYKNLLDTLKSNIEEDKIEENDELWNINEDSYCSDDIEELKNDKKKIHQLDSPFIQNENRSKDDILCFIEILRNYLDLKTSDKKVYIDLLNCSDSDAEFLTKLFKFAKLKRK